MKISRNAAGYRDRKHRRGKSGVRPGTHEGGTWWSMLAELKQIAKKTANADKKEAIRKSQGDEA